MKESTHTILQLLCKEYKSFSTIGYMSNRKEAIFAMLAAASMGAMFGGPLPFYGAKVNLVVLKPLKPSDFNPSDLVDT